MGELILTALIITFLAFVRANQMSPDGPKDPQARVQWQSSNCLAQLKGELTDCRLVEVQPNEVRLQQNGQELRIGCRDGQVYTERKGTRRILQSLGPQGSLKFSTTSPGTLAISITADSGQGSRREVGIRLELQPA
jgi:hypothetical protein